MAHESGWVIDKIKPNTGRIIQEDGTTVNIADLVQDIIDGLSDIEVTVLPLSFGGEDVSNTTGSSAIAKSLTSTDEWIVKEFRLHLSAVGGSGNLTVTLNAGSGSAYDVVLKTVDMTEVIDWYWAPDNPIILKTTDAIDIAWANANGKTYGLEVVYMTK
jgi:hypothetical protein